ncbi:MAG: hypothetical protein N2039_00065 [Gemmataceae bacterium]|nr:hypothetical protein [Gemmataceae bacterium]
MVIICFGCDPVPHSDAAADPPSASRPARTRIGEIRIRAPQDSPRVATSLRDEKGQPVSVACANCHSTRPPNPAHRLGLPLTEFHQHVSGNHGELSCAACHNPDDGYETLRRADGTTLSHADVISLCAQCHGPQYRDYLHGAHGGMTGYWDLSRGHRERNNCTDCHAPHSPKYPILMPAPGPNDRIPLRRGHD